MLHVNHMLLSRGSDVDGIKLQSIDMELRRMDSRPSLKVYFLQCVL